MPNGSRPGTSLAADPDETGRPSAKTLLLRDFWRRVTAFLYIAFDVRDSNARRTIAKRETTWDKSKKKERLERRARTKEKAPVRLGGGELRIPKTTQLFCQKKNAALFYQPFSYVEIIIPNPHNFVKRYYEKPGVFEVFFLIFFRGVKNRAKVRLTAEYILAND
jgi:hypothetical protein